VDTKEQIDFHIKRLSMGILNRE